MHWYSGINKIQTMPDNQLNIESGMWQIKYYYKTLNMRVNHL